MNDNLKPKKPESKSKPGQVIDLPMSLAQFEGLLADIDEFSVDPVERIGTRVKWFITWKEYGDDWLGYVSAHEYERDRIKVKFYDLYFSNSSTWLRIMVDRVTEELKSRGLLPNVPEANRRKGGRPRYPEDEWVREQVFIHYCDRKELFDEWLEKAKANGRQFADPKDTYRRIFKLKPEETE